MTEATDHQRLSSTSYHNYHPPGSVFLSLLKICKLVDVMNFNVFSRSTKFTGISKESFD